MFLVKEYRKKSMLSIRRKVDSLRFETKEQMDLFISQWNAIFHNNGAVKNPKKENFCFHSGIEFYLVIKQLNK